MRRALSVLNDEKGLSFIEVLMAMAILMVVSLALMQTALIGYQENNKNVMRDEAVRIVEEEINELRNKAFDGPELAKTPSPVAYGPIDRTFRSATFRYNPSRNIQDINNNIKQVTISVSWSVKQKTYTHSSTAIIRRLQ